MKPWIRVSLLLYFAVLSGCSSGPALFLGGTWNFTLSPSSSSSQAIQATAVLTQLNNSIFGPVTFSDNSASCSTQAMISGTLNGNKVTFQLTASQSTFSLSGTVTGGPPLTYNATGKYAATNGGCLQTTGPGTWSAYLVANGG